MPNPRIYVAFSKAYFFPKKEVRSKLLGQQPSRLVGDAKLVLQLPRRDAVGMRRHQMRSPEPGRQMQFGALHDRARRDRGLSATVEAFVEPRAAIQRGTASLAAGRADETAGPTALEQERHTMRLVGKRILKLGRRAPPRHRLFVSAIMVTRMAHTTGSVT